MIISGMRYLENNKALVDSMNVFPVPDGDTGTNMTLTMTSVIKEIKSVESDSVSELSKAVSKGALKGARGNSGVILSQIFRGMNEVIGNVSDEITTKTFAQALTEGARVAYSAVSKPKEGTILTIIRMVAKHAETVSGKMQEFEEFLDEILKKGNEVLKQTPEMLPILKKANTVDAGGKGLLCVFTGFFMAIKGIEVEESAPSEEASVQSAVEYYAEDEHNLEEITFGYCTEFFVMNLNDRATEADIDKMRDYLTKIGDCVLVIGDLGLVKVHVHTNEPGKALNYAVGLGELDGVKIENMRKQSRELKEKREAEKVPQAIISICAGKGLSDIFLDLGVAEIIEGGQTMNPSVDDILNAINRVNSDIIFVMPNNKNIIFAANQAKEMTEKKCFVIPSKNIPQGIAAALAYNIEAEPEVNDKNMTDALLTVTSGQVSHAVRDASIDDLEVKIGDIIGLDDKNILVKGDNVADVTAALVVKLKASREHTDQLSIYFGEDVTEEDSEKLADRIRSEHPEFEVLSFYGGQPHYYYLISLE
jgi:DAK2 domain fusion protein YloV